MAAYTKSHSHDAEFEAVNSSPTFILLVAVVAIAVGVPLAIWLM
ncbi:MAG: hypothetical protein AAFW81_00420 [Pseudomonadota bacterium]